MYNSLTRKQIYHCLVCDEGTGAKAEVTKTLEISIHVHGTKEKGERDYIPALCILISTK